MKRTIFILFLILIPVAIAQNITTTTGQLPANYTLDMEINDLQANDTIELGSDDWITLETNTFHLGENDTNYTFHPTLSIPLTDEGNYTKKVYYNATGLSNFEIPIEIEIRNDTETYQAFLENEEKKYLDCIINKLKDTNNNTTARMKAEYECRYEVTNNPNGTIVIQKETIIEEKPVISTETETKIGTIETTITEINTEIGTMKTELETLKTEILNRIQNLEDNLTSQTNTENSSNSGINWTLLIITVGGVALIMAIVMFMMKRKKQQKGLFKKKEPKNEFDRLI